MFLSKNNLIARIGIDIVLIIMAYMIPWWCSLVVAIVCVAFFPRFFEILILGVMLDSLYNAPVASLFRFEFVVTAIAFVALVCITYLKQRIRLNR